MPRTAAGKIQKFQLRERAKALRKPVPVPTESPADGRRAEARLAKQERTK